MDYESLLGALVTLFIVSVVLERALTVLFHWRWWKRFCNGKGLKTVVAVAISWAVCSKYGFDVFAMMFGKEAGTGGYLVTALFVSGGSKLVLSVINQINAFKEQSGLRQN